MAHITSKTFKSCRPVTYRQHQWIAKANDGKTGSALTLEALKARLQAQQEKAKEMQLEKERMKEESYKVGIKPLRSMQKLTTSCDPSNGVYLFDDNSPESMMKILEGTNPALIDRTDWEVIQVSGEDTISFLNGLSTNNIEQLRPGEWMDTVFTTRSGRIIDLVKAIRTKDASVLLLVSPDLGPKLIEILNKYVIMQSVKISSLSNDFCTFTILRNHIGEENVTVKLLSEIFGEPITSNKCGIYQWSRDKVEDGGKTLPGAILIKNSTGLSLPGETILVPVSMCSHIWETFSSIENIITLGKGGWEILRILQGRPAHPMELNERYNPMEAQLWQSLSFDKGCYVGQETIARLKTYKGVKQLLWSIDFDEIPPNFNRETGSTIYSTSGEKIGLLCSLADVSQINRGLGYIRTRSKVDGKHPVAGTAVVVEGVVGRLKNTAMQKELGSTPEWMFEI